MNHNKNVKGQPYVCLDTDGYLQLYTDKGELVKGNLSITLDESFDAPIYANAKFKVNFAGSKLSMLTEIAEWNY